MKIYILIILIIFFNQVFSQSTESNKRGPCGEVTEHLYIINGNIFYPKTQVDNKPQSEIKFCDGYKHIYYLEGLQLTENDFLKIGLKRKDIIEKKSEYAYQYRNNDTMNCVEFINLFVMVSIPIKLNGMELRGDEREKKLRSFTAGKIVSIVRKKTFGKGIIEIKTM